MRGSGSPRFGILVAALLLAPSCGGGPEPDPRAGLPEPAPPPEPETRPAPPPEIDEEPLPPLPPPSAETGFRYVFDRKRLPNGLRLLIGKAPEGETARLVVQIEAGPEFDPPGKAGLAARTARTLLSALEASPEFSELDAGLELEIGPPGVRFLLRCPPRNLGHALPLLFQGLVEPDLGAADLASPGRSRMSVPPAERLLTWYRRRLLGETPPPPERVSRESAALNPAAIDLFHRHYYRPGSTTLLVLSPKLERKTLREALRPFEEWKTAPPLQSPPLGPILPLAWGRDPRPGGGTTAFGSPALRVSLIFPDPSPEFLGDARPEILWQAFCADGSGGTLSRVLASKGLTPFPAGIDSPRGQRMAVRCLDFEIPEDRFRDLLSAVREAITLLSQDPPDPTLWRTALSRANLAWNLKLDDPEERWRILLAADRAGLPGDLDEKVRRSLSEARPQDLPDLVATWLRPAVLVLGPEGTRPEGAVLLEGEEAENRPGTALSGIRAFPEARKPDEEEVARLLSKARLAIGGETLTAKKVFRYEAELHLIGALPCLDRWKLRFRGKKTEGETDPVVLSAIRRRRILRTEILTRMEGGKCIESLSGTERKLSPEESSWFRMEAVLHPAVLLDPKVFPDSGFRPVGRIRSPQGVDLLVLEPDPDRTPGLRIAIDPDTGLVRRVQWPEWTPGRKPKQATWLLRDYRDAGSLRLPYAAFFFRDGAYEGEIVFRYRP